jgi:hypothetical protein
MSVNHKRQVYRKLHKKELEQLVCEPFPAIYQLLWQFAFELFDCRSLVAAFVARQLVVATRRVQEACRVECRKAQ